MNDGEIIAAMTLGQAFESYDQHVYVSRSTDNGAAWRSLGPMYLPGPGGVPTTECCRIAKTPDGEIVVFMLKYNRSRVDVGYTNEDNMGFVETELNILRSRDKGISWSGPDAFTPPLVGPNFELCCPITMLKDGRWIIPTSTWRGWDGYCPNGMKAVALVSYDKGQTWPEYMDVMADVENKWIFWESKVIQLNDGRLLGVAWTYDEKNAKELANHYSISDKSGRVFSKARSTRLNGQTLTPVLLDNGKVLSLYRRVDKPGLWANISRIEDDDWINEYECPVWGYSSDYNVAQGTNLVHNFQVLRFGAPNIVKLNDGTIFVAIWAVEDNVSNIRWFKIAVD